MYQGLFASTTVPILEQVVDFAQARHEVLAGNLANMDTPGYRTRDLAVDDFQAHLQQAIRARHEPVGRSPGDLIGQDGSGLANAAKDPKTILHHDQSNVGMEYQVTEMAKNQLLHNVAMAIMASQFRLLGAAISERA